MKKIYVSVSLSLALSLAASAQSKFDGQSLAAISHYLEAKANPASNLVKPVDIPFEITRTARGAEAQAGVIIILEPGYSFDIIESAGLKIESTLGGDMCVATGSLDDIIALNDLEGVKSLSFGGKADPTMNVARSSSYITEVQAGTNIYQAYKGTGVVCGIYDSGIDPNHINFYDADFKKLRVKTVNYFTGNSGGCESYTTENRIASFTTDSKSGTHGTHTLGCMTGAFCLKGNSAASTGRPTGIAAVMNSTNTGVTALSSTANPYYGSAPDADIYVNCGALYDANIIAGLGRAVDYAKSKGQPLVFNLSVGSISGPHDGSDAIGQALERAGEYGIVCIAAGNDGEENISIQKTLTATDKEVKTFLNFPTNSQGMVDIYGSTSQKFSLTIAIADKTTGAIIYRSKYDKSGTTYLTTKEYTNPSYDHAAAFDNAFTKSNLQITISDAPNGRHAAHIYYDLNASNLNSDRNMVIAFIVEGESGQRIDMTNRVTSGSANFASNNLTGWSNGTNDFTISSMACGKNLIVVGSWTSRVKWPTVGRQVYSYTSASNLTEDQVSPFTSFGVTWDGRSLPDLCAPGAAVVSSYNSYYSSSSSYDVCRYTYKDRTYVWQAEQGTSMATPVLAGAVATWLEAKPTLNVDEVREILKSTAQPLSGGNAIQRGAGKLDAYTGLKKVLEMDEVKEIKSDNDLIFSNLGGNMYEVFNSAGNINVAVYSLSGIQVLNVSTSGNTQSLDLSKLSKGIYLVNINGAETHRVAVN